MVNSDQDIHYDRGYFIREAMKDRAHSFLMALPAIKIVDVNQALNIFEALKFQKEDQNFLSVKRKMSCYMLLSSYATHLTSDIISNIFNDPTFLSHHFRTEELVDFLRKYQLTHFVDGKFLSLLPLDFVVACAGDLDQTQKSVFKDDVLHNVAQLLSSLVKALFQHGKENYLKSLNISSDELISALTDLVQSEREDIQLLELIVNANGSLSHAIQLKALAATKRKQIIDDHFKKNKGILTTTEVIVDSKESSTVCGIGWDEKKRQLTFTIHEKNLVCAAPRSQRSFISILRRTMFIVNGFGIIFIPCMSETSKTILEKIPSWPTNYYHDYSVIRDQRQRSLVLLQGMDRAARDQKTSLASEAVLFLRDISQRHPEVQLNINDELDEVSDSSSSRIFANIDRILKEYNFFTQYHKWPDQAERTQLQDVDYKDMYTEVHSVNKDKYISLACSQNGLNLRRILLSDQSGLYNWDRKRIGASRLLTENWNLGTCGELEKFSLDWLASQHFLSINQGTGRIKTNAIRVLATQAIDTYGALDSRLLSENLLEELKSTNDFQVDNKLFAPIEARFMNFIYKSFYTNGLAVRNHVQHGSSGDQDQEIKNYYWALFDLLIVAFKIDDDLLLDSRYVLNYSGFLRKNWLNDEEN